jgi:hypothetical protein
MMVRCLILLLSLLESASSFTSLQPRYFIAKPQALRTTLGSSPIKQSAADLQSEEYQKQELSKPVMIYTSSIKTPKTTCKLQEAQLRAQCSELPTPINKACWRLVQAQSI